MRDLNSALDSFDYHQPSQDQIDRIASNRKAYKSVVEVLFKNIPDCPDRTCAIRQLHESMMTANKAIVLEKK